MPHKTSTIQAAAEEPTAQGEPNIEVGALLSDVIAKHAADVEVTPDADAVALAMKAHSEAVKAKQAADKAAKVSARAKPAKPTVMKPTTKAKAEPKPKAAKTAIERVPAQKVIALIEELGLTRTQYGQALGISPSMAVEHCGKGRGNLLRADRWAEVQKTVRAFAKTAKVK
jgi:hypothetical protein